MRLSIVGAKWLGGEAVARLEAEGYEIANVVAPDAGDRTAETASRLGLPVRTLDGRRHVEAGDVADGVDVLLTIGSTAIVDAGARAKARLAALGYHPSLLPRHRGSAAVEWTVKMGDAVAGGSIYHLEERLDAGAIAMQDWCHVRPGERAGDLWRRALAPMGLELTVRVLAHARAHGSVPAVRQDEAFATEAPRLAREG